MPRAARAGRLRGWLLNSLILGVLACGHRAAAPSDVLRAYGAAVVRGDFAAAYALMSDAFRRRTSLAEFERTMRIDAAERAEQARSLEGAAAQRGQRVEVSWGPDRGVSLIREQGAWRIEEQPLEPYGQGTPRAALRSFLRALAGRRYDVLLRLAPARRRRALTAETLRSFWEGERAPENRALLQALQLAVDAPIAEEGDEAFLVYDANRTLRFVREAGLWRLDAPN